MQNSQVVLEARKRKLNYTMLNIGHELERATPRA